MEIVFILWFLKNNEKKNVHTCSIQMQIFWIFCLSLACISGIHWTMKHMHSINPDQIQLPFIHLPNLPCSHIIIQTEILASIYENAHAVLMFLHLAYFRCNLQNSVHLQWAESMDAEPAVTESWLCPLSWLKVVIIIVNQIGMTKHTSAVVLTPCCLCYSIISEFLLLISNLLESYSENYWWLPYTKVFP
jgi:hypothetical protein